VVAKETCKVVVVANPCNTNCLILQRSCPNIPKANFTFLNLLDHNRAVAAIAKRAGVFAKDVKQVIVWGSHSYYMYPDLTFATVNNANVELKIEDTTFLSVDFEKKVKKRGGEIQSYKKNSAIFSAAIALRDHAKYWHYGT